MPGVFFELVKPPKAVIDVGTNSIKLLVMEERAGGAAILADRNEIVRLGEGAAKSGRLSEEAVARAVAVIKDMAREASSLGSGEVLAVATQAVRGASNAEDFNSLVKLECGFGLRIISGDEEAGLSFRAILSALPRSVPAICAFDVGGGSTEVIAGSTSGISYRRSVPIGALSLHDEFFAEPGRNGAVSDDALKAASDRVRMMLRGEGASLPATPEAAGVGGTITTLAAVALSLDSYDAGLVSGMGLSIAEVERQIKLFAATSVPERARAIKGLSPKRADIILAGACIVRELLDFARKDVLIVLDRGLRYGVMEKYFGIS
jgi:exopolyphosphatase/guanosine-5'-triphosphate,3'-diphosphate pyrophosphatase